MTVSAAQQIKQFTFLPPPRPLEWWHAEELLRRNYVVMWVPKQGEHYFFEQRPCMLRRILRCMALWVPVLQSYVARPIQLDCAKRLVTEVLKFSTVQEDRTLRVFLACFHGHVDWLGRPRLLTPGP